MSGDALSLTAGVVNNTSGQVVANGLLGWNSQALNNQSGLIQGRGISINTAGQTLDNRRGTLNSLQELTVSTGAMDNRGGTVGAKTTADLSTTSLDNREGAGWSVKVNSVCIREVCRTATDKYSLWATCCSTVYGALWTTSLV
ncbi:hypothetical protein N5T16_09485 [Escherichia coli]|uniref:hypothetical protein n=1 Tax=Escherichia coli TaxID=562 RepID=UPI002226F98D|nr:hypothetical protein [Escherichia coli]MCW3279137.1 hypothetical protein [Escherichia coli]